MLQAEKVRPQQPQHHVDGEDGLPLCYSSNLFRRSVRWATSRTHFCVREPRGGNEASSLRFGVGQAEGVEAEVAREAKRGREARKKRKRGADERGMPICVVVIRVYNSRTEENAPGIKIY